MVSKGDSADWCEEEVALAGTGLGVSELGWRGLQPTIGATAKKMIASLR